MMKTKVAAIAACIFIVFEMIAPLAMAADGDLDATFGGAGIVITAVSEYNDNARCIGIQSDGKIVVAGQLASGSANRSLDSLVAIRYNSNGSLDTSFDADGIAIPNFDDDYEWAGSLAFHSDGKIVFGGYVYDAIRRPPAYSKQSNFMVARINSDGSKDTGFGDDPGYTPLDLSLAPGLHSYGYGVAVQSDGKIVCGGIAATDTVINYNSVALRFNSDGALDGEFGSEGIVNSDFGGSDGHCAVALQSDGKVVMAGFASLQFAVVRYNSDGSLDSGFGSGGIATTDIGVGTDVAYALLIQPDGKIVLAGYADNGSNRDFALVRYNVDGSLDTGFGSGGKVTMAIGAGDDVARGVGIDSWGRIFAAGETHNGDDYDIALVRYNADGTLDTGFGANGIVTVDTGNGNDRAWGIAVDSAGRPVLAACINGTPGGDVDFGALRFESTPMPAPAAGTLLIIR